jgi:serine/threonine protein kinase/tetratricopeptide (TPR) repeat protein
MRSKKDGLLELAAAIAEGSAVDWDHVESGASDSELRSLVDQLRTIAMIAGAHSSQDQPPEPQSNPGRRHSDAPGEGGVERAAGDLERWGELMLIEEVGQGSFGTVYRAHDPQLDRPVAVKLLRRASATDEQLASRLLHEGQTLARVHHPNVVTVYGAAKHDGRVGLWMEFVRGLTLEQMLVSHGPFSAREAGLVGYELCGALAAVHRAGLVHRDVKAQNVMREEGGRLVLVDFGAGQKRAELGIVGGRAVGTPLYLAPEVINGAAATTRSDVYSLGVLLYHLVTDDFPVKAATFSELVAARARGEITPLRDARPHLPKAFIQVVERATDPDPERRFASAGRLEAALAQVIGSTKSKTPAPRLRTAERGTQRAGKAARGRDMGVPSVAVLPFSDMSPSKDQECFCEGMTDELINALAQISGLRVAARTSAFQFKGQSRDIRRIGDALNVATVLDGSVRKDGDRLRITVELICSADGYHLWSQRFDRDLVDVFAVQDEIAGSVVSMLKGRLAADSRAALIAPHTHDLDAYGFYLEGRYHWNKRTEDELKKSVGCFEHAIDRDPGYAQAYSGMADAYITLGTYGAMPPKDVMPRAKGALERALEIDAGLGEAYTCRGCVRAVYDWSWSDAEHDFRRAIELKPSYPTAHHWYAINHLVPVGRFDEATEELRHALDLDPLAIAIKNSVGMKCYFAGRYDDAVRELSKTIELDGSFGMARYFLSATYTELSRYPEAIAELEAAIRLCGRSPEMLAALGYLHGVSGNVIGARGILEELRRLADLRYVSPARIAQVHVGIGERAEALDRLEEAHAERAADLAWLNVRPVFASLRDEPRFTALLNAMRLSPSSPVTD